ncbi:MAG: hypothetical protein IJW54_03185 [Clostridia bacterium]|nr:hypothetical protein [Clostridia bacterium]
MKKKLLCLAIAMLMVLPMILASCSDVRSDEEIIASILGGEDAAIAHTLSIWIPTESNTDDPNFKERVEAVENAINAILVEKNYTTQIKIEAVNDSEYEKKLSDRFLQMGNNAGQAYTDGLKYKNEIDYYYPDEENKEDFIYKLKYPDVLDYQLDLFLIRGYENYMSYYEKNYISDKTDGFIRSGKTYSNISKLIRPSILEQMKINGKIYAVPNNHLYADEYQYVAINKNVFDSLGFDASDLTDIYACESFIITVGEKLASGELSNVVPFVGTLNDAPNSKIYDEDSLIGAGFTDGNVSNIFASKDYTDYVSFYKRLSEKGYVGNDPTNAAVQFLYGTSENIESAYGDDYYLIKSRGPVATTDDIFESMFAISTYSIEYERAMKFLYLLQSDVEVRTLLQYGIEGEDYTIVFDEEKKENIIKVKDDTPYKMNILYTGNNYYTYPENGSLNDWDDVKDANRDLIVDPFICFDEILNSDKISDSEKELLEENKLAVVTLIDAYLDEINGMTSEEFDKFASIDFATIIWEDLAFYKEEMGYEKLDMLDSLESDYSKLEKEKSKIAKDEELSDDEKATLISEIDKEINLISLSIREVLNYRLSDKEISYIINDYKTEIAKLEKEIADILNNAELEQEYKDEIILEIQEEIAEINVKVSYYDAKRTSEESNVKASLIQSLIDHVNSEIESLIAEEKDDNADKINDYKKLVNYLSNEIAEENGGNSVLLTDVELNEYVELLDELIDILDLAKDNINDDDSLDDSTKDSQIKVINELNDYVLLLQEIKEYEIVINEYLYEIDIVLEPTKGYEFAVDLYDNDKYKLIIDFYSKLANKN